MFVENMCLACWSSGLSRWAWKCHCLLSWCWPTNDHWPLWVSQEILLQVGWGMLSWVDHKSHNVINNSASQGPAQVLTALWQASYFHKGFSWLQFLSVICLMSLEEKLYRWNMNRLFFLRDPTNMYQTRIISEIERWSPIVTHFCQCVVLAVLLIKQYNATW